MSQTWGPGTVILGRYRLDSMLGRGGMGSVFRAEHLQLKSPVAVKLLDPSIATNPQILARFLREAQSAASLRSPHVVQIFDYGVEEGTAFIAMELLQGESLSDRISRLGKLAPDETFRFVGQVLRAISKAHDAGIVHRDLKPDNVFICQDEPEFAKVLDFGVAKVEKGEFTSSNAPSRTQTGMMIGTPYYMSPEQTQAKAVDARSDLWAIAVMTFECLTGKRPFTGDSFGELVIAICTRPTPIPSKESAVPEGFDEWFVKGTQRDPARRFQTAREMADELAKIAGLPVTASRAAPIPIASTAPRPERAAEPLQMTTGSGAATSGSVSPSDGGGLTVQHYLLGGIAAAIVVGVGLFFALGGPAALRSAPSAEPAAAAALPAAEPNTPPVASPAPAPTPIPVAAPSLSAPPAAASAEAKPAAKAKTVRSDAVKKAEPAKEAQPPKNWNF